MDHNRQLPESEPLLEQNQRGSRKPDIKETILFFAEFKSLTKYENSYFSNEVCCTAILFSSISFAYKFEKIKARGFLGLITIITSFNAHVLVTHKLSEQTNLPVCFSSECAA